MILDQLLQDDVSSILIKGNPGAGKSTFARELLRRNGGGIYVTTRVGASKIKVEKGGFELLVPNRQVGPIPISMNPDDIRDFTLASVKNVVELVLDDHAVSKRLVVIDSWDSIGNEVDLLERYKVEKTLVAAAQSRGPKVCFVAEESRITPSDYIVDAVVDLKLDMDSGSIRRVMEVTKLRGHNIEYPRQLFTLEGGRFAEMKPTEVLLPGQYRPKGYVPTPNPTGMFASGIPDLDSLLGGGFRPATSFALEYSSGVSQLSLHPSFMVILANFLANGNPAMFVPTSGVSPSLILSSIRSMLRPDLVNSCFRLGYYEDFDDPCTFKLDPDSGEKTFEKIRDVMVQLKGKEHKPCLVLLGVAKMELMHGPDAAMKGVSTLLTKGKNEGDLVAFTSSHTTGCKEAIASMADARFLLETFGNTLTSHGLKPLLPIMAVGYDYSAGYPQVRMQKVS